MFRSAKSIATLNCGDGFDAAIDLNGFCKVPIEIVLVSFMIHVYCQYCMQGQSGQCLKCLQNANHWYNCESFIPADVS